MKSDPFKILLFVYIIISANTLDNAKLMSYKFPTGLPLTTNVNTLMKIDDVKMTDHGKLNLKYNFLEVFCFVSISNILL